MPPMFVVDVAPFINVIVITDPFISEQITTSTERYPYGGPRKSWTSHDVWPITGKHGLLTLEGEEWKTTRKRFSPGFQPSHIRNVMLPMFVEQAKHFVNNIEKEFQAGEPFHLTKLCQAFTLDVIGLMVLNKDFHTQTLPDDQGLKRPGGLLWAFQVVQNGTTHHTNFWEYVDLKAHYEAWKAARILKNEYKWMINDALEAAEKDETSPRSILSLSLKKQDLTPEVLEHASHQLRTFLFAGYDTTASTIAWTFYYLGIPASRPYLEAIWKELDEVLGPDDEEAERRLSSDAHLPLLWNAMKESMRVQPAAGGSRFISNSEPDFFLTLPSGQRCKVNDTVMFSSHKLIHTNPKIWGSKGEEGVRGRYDSYEFHPERWADEEYMRQIPKGAFRPFEMGPRDCIGQEVARTEMKVVLALTLRNWRFEKVTRKEDMDPELGEVWGKFEILAVPSDGMRGVVKRRDDEMA